MGLTRRREPAFRLVETVLVPLLGAWFRWHLEGLDNIPGAGPAIIASNHIAYLDPLAVGYAVVRAGRRPRFLAKSELFADRRIGPMLRATGQIEVLRGTARAREALGSALSALAQGEVVVIFPEGTVTTDPDLKPMAARSGAVRLALRSRAPLIPCAVWGTANVWPKGDYRKSWRPGQDLLVRVGEPMLIEGDPDAPVAWRAAGERIMGALAGLVAGLQPVVADARRPSHRRSA
jgi:1-acyl-sn-glycerol-3-phosphate acyltransferase